MDFQKSVFSGQESGRIRWLDVGKGFGIFFIAWGHVLRTGRLRTFIYGFHVVLFFILLGYTFKYTDSFLCWIKKRFVKTMIPYYIWSCFSIVLYLALARFISIDGDDYSTSIWKNFAGMLYANSRTGYMKWNQPLWFIPCMNLTLSFVWLAEHILNRLKSKGIWVGRYFIVITFAVLGLLFEKINNVKFPFQLESAIFMVSFTEMGMCFKESKRIEKISAVKFKYLIMLSLLSVGVGLVTINGIAGIRSCYYGKYPVLYCMEATSLSLFIMLLAYRFQKSRLMSEIGKNSFSIMLMHKFPILFFQSLCPTTKDLLKKPDTLEGILCSFIVTCLSILLCYFAISIIEKEAPVTIGR